jgi:protein phosphatase
VNITLPELSLVVLVGPSGCGKSTFARKHFKPTEILSSDHFRAAITDDESDQAVTPAAFELLHLTCAKRLQAARLTVIDATNVQVDARQQCLDTAKRYHTPAIALVFDLPEQLCIERNLARTERVVSAKVVKGHADGLRRSLKRLKDEGFRAVHVLTTPEEVEAVTITREPLRVNRKSESGPFDIIGDVHGCLDELKDLFVQLGYTVNTVADVDGRDVVDVVPPTGRKALFVGDLVDRGPDTPGVLRLVMRMITAGTGLCVRGNHDDKLLRHVWGRKVNITHGLAETLEQLAQEPPEFTERLKLFLEALPTHYVLDGGKLVIAHAGLKEHLQGRVSERVRAFCLYGETTGESDEFGLPIRLNWAADYRGRATVVYGHTPTLYPEWLNRTICIDTGCVFGGTLTALQYPGSELVSVPARRQYAEPKRPMLPPPAPVPMTAQQVADDVLDLADVTGKRLIPTRLMQNIQIREGNSAAALEAMSRFAVNPRWLIYLPPTMSPCASATESGYLEYPREAFSYFARENVARVVCEQKHMGSRAIAVICKDEEAATRRFGVSGEGSGIVITRTGRRFFDNTATEAELVNILRQALTAANWWERFQSEWFCFDGELMPWSAKAQELLRTQYAATGSAATAALNAVLQTFPPNGSPELIALAKDYHDRSEAVEKYVESYRRYCWPVNSVSDLRYAPFHLLASEGKVHTDRDHVWHMNTLAELVPHGAPVLLATPYLVVETNDSVAVERACKWWEEFTNNGVEGMVVKPLAWEVRGRKGLVQPAMKVRGREYLRIIYGPEYTQPQHLERLRQRNTGHKQALALREFALGLEALERFVRREPLRKIHECVFGVLALESEPVDPRL